MKRTRMIVIAGSVLLVASCGGRVKFQDYPDVRLGTGESRKVEIHAIGALRGTGVMVRTGERYRISATGTWSNGPICGVTEADGRGASGQCRNDPLNFGFLTHSLAGRIGQSGTPFFVGKRLDLEPRENGELFLEDYDHPDWYGVNSGSVDVTITNIPRVAATSQATTTSSASDSELARQKLQIERLKQEAEIARLKAAAERDKAKRANPEFPTTPVAVNFKRGQPNPDDVAVTIGNANYSRQGKDIPDVTPAYADAAGFKRYAMQALGIREGNIIDLKDASSAQLVRVFGSEKDYRGQLYDWTRPGESRVFVYYAGHGAPAGADGSAYIVPADADGSRIQLNGYPLSVLYNNLSKVPAKSMTVVLEACFSGAAQAGAVISNASPVFAKAKAPLVPANITVISAGGANQMASWESDKSSGLFTKYFLMGMSGKADTAKTGNGDGRVDYAELERYLERTLTYFARRHYGRDQAAVIQVGKGG